MKVTPLQSRDFCPALGRFSDDDSVSGRVRRIHEAVAHLRPRSRLSSFWLSLSSASSRPSGDAHSEAASVLQRLDDGSRHAVAPEDRFRQDTDVCWHFQGTADMAAPAALNLGLIPPQGFASDVARAGGCRRVGHEGSRSCLAWELIALSLRLSKPSFDSGFLTTADWWNSSLRHRNGRATMKILIAMLALCASTTAMAQSEHHVNGYTRADGTYVAPHEQTNPNSTRNDNWSTQGNVNPYTGVEGTKPRDSYSSPTPPKPRTNPYGNPYQPNW
jgi:hypothetical protein